MPGRRHHRAEIVDARGDGHLAAGGLAPGVGAGSGVDHGLGVPPLSWRGRGGGAGAPPFPKLDGQHAAYLDKQLREYKTGKRKSAIMAP